MTHALHSHPFLISRHESFIAAWPYKALSGVVVLPSARSLCCGFMLWSRDWMIAARGNRHGRSSEVGELFICWEHVNMIRPVEACSNALRGSHLRALVFLLLRFRRRTRFFLHLALILASWLLFQ
jgi:hypothetical protein